MSGAQDQAAKASEKQVAEETPSLLGKVKDTLNFTKHLGFVSDLDSPANQRALAVVQEKREKDLAQGVPEEAEQAPLSERLKQGVGNVANTAMEASSVAGVAMAPPSEGPKERAEDLTGIGEKNESDVKSPGVDAEESREGADGSESKKSGNKILGALGMGNKTANSSNSEEGESDTKAFGRWAAGAYKTMGHAVASKDIDLPKD